MASKEKVECAFLEKMNKYLSLILFLIQQVFAGPGKRNCPTNQSKGKFKPRINR